MNVASPPEAWIETLTKEVANGQRTCVASPPEAWIETF